MSGKWRGMFGPASKPATLEPAPTLSAVGTTNSSFEGGIFFMFPTCNGFAFKFGMSDACLKTIELRTGQKIFRPVNRDYGNTFLLFRFQTSNFFATCRTVDFGSNYSGFAYMVVYGALEPCWREPGESNHALKTQPPARLRYRARLPAGLSRSLNHEGLLSSAAGPDTDLSDQNPDGLIAISFDLEEALMSCSAVEHS